MSEQTLVRLRQYAFASQVQNHGFDPEDAIIEIAPRPGEFWVREEDILDVIEKEGSKIALVLFGAISYYTGQWFPMKSVTKAAKAKVHPLISENRGFFKFTYGSRDAFVGGTWPMRLVTCHFRSVNGA